SIKSASKTQKTGKATKNWEVSLVSTVFFDDEDRQMYLKLLSGYAQRYHLSIWAYCLMDNHIHILAVPETETALS
ncbi:transposase, partial [Geobacter chapellei]|nr:transposase [Pelotalea chapellei]